MKRAALLIVLLVACADPPAAPAPTPGPTPQVDEAASERRRAFLRHYAPVILQRANEGPTTRGRDWIADAFFDGDRNLANNARNWKQPAKHRARPTLYTALIETGKTIVLLYHVYHPAQRGSIHDWERVELRLDGVGPAPGGGERLTYAVITEHKKHNAPSTYTSRDINFLTTPSGKRLLVWQADQFGAGKLRKGELHFVEEPAAALAKARAVNGPARVDINGAGPTPFHYLYVPAHDDAAAKAFGAQPLTPERAAGTAAPVTWAKVVALQYELQDLADLLPTHLDPTSWRDELRIRLRSPVRDHAGRVVIPASAGPEGTRFFVRARDVLDPEESRRGYPRKHWFWGTYRFDRKGSFTSTWLKSLPGPVPQHDYFLHSGTKAEPGGRWLRESDGWWRAGWDGRWEALFPPSERNRRP